jgi:hypothetical protein
MSKKKCDEDKKKEVEAHTPFCMRQMWAVGQKKGETLQAG